MKVRIDMPTGPMLVKLKAIPQQQRTAMAAAMNTTVKQAEVDVVSEMRRVFDRPTPWALGGITHDKASASSLDAVVRVRGKVGAAIPAESFLRAQIEGGSRRFKRFEVALYKAGAMPAGYYAMPGPGARMDAFGNMSGGHITQILAWFQAFPASGYRSNTSAASREKRKKGTRRTRGTEYFSVGPGTRGLTPGVYQRTDFGALGKGVRMVLAFQKRATYRIRLDFEGVARRTVEEQLPRQVLAETGRAIGSGGRL